MPKKALSTRLETDLISRLKRASIVRQVPVNDLISLGLDALEGNREVTETITERIVFLEKNLADLVDVIAVHIEKMDRLFIEAGASEKERLKALYLLLETKLSDHDAAERERFENLIPRDL